jgi:hypothetical protein
MEADPSKFKPSASLTIQEEINTMMSEIDNLGIEKYSRRQVEMNVSRQDMSQNSMSVLRRMKKGIDTLKKTKTRSGVWFKIAGLKPDFFSASGSTLLESVESEGDGVDDEDEDAITFAQASTWTTTPHIWSVDAFLHGYVYHLELLSKHGSVEVPVKFPLDKPTVRIGSFQYCELSFQCRGAVKREGMISKLHAIISVPVSVTESFKVTVLDNNSLWGTYVVSRHGARKVPTKLSAAVILEPGDLICFGVVKDGPESLDVTDAGKAVVVYRVRCKDIELKQSF